MTSLDKKLFRDLKESWPLLLAVSAIIAVGIGCFIAMMSAKNNLEYAKSGYYSTCRLADFWIDLKKAPNGEVDRLASIPGVSEIRKRISFRIMLDFNDAQKPIGAQVISLPDTKSPVINNIILKKGTYFTHDRPNEVIVAEKFAIARGIEPGDTLTAILNGQKKELIVTGIAISAEFVYMTSPGSMIDDAGNYGLIYIKQSFAEDSFGFSSACNSVVGLLAPEARGESKRIVEQISERLSPYGVFVGLPRAEQFSPMVLDSEMKQLGNMAIIFPMFFLVVASLVLNVLMTRLAEQQRTVIGTLKALGYNDITLMLHFVKFAATTGLTGGLLGCVSGYFMAGLFTKTYVEYFSFPELTNLFYPSLCLIGIGVSLLFSILGTIKGVKRIMTLEPAEAMRQAAPQSGGKVFVERISPVWKRLDAQWQMIIRGLLRNKGRTLVAIISAALGSSIVVLAFGFVDSMGQMVTLQFDRVLRSDYHLTFSSEMNSSGFDEVRALPGITHAEPVLNVACTFRVQNHVKRGVIMGIVTDGELTKPLNKVGEVLDLPPVGLLMANRLMETLGVQEGEYVDVIPVKGERRVYQLPVVQGIDSMLGLSVYADYHWLNRVFGERGAISEVRVLATHSPQIKKQFLEKLKSMPGLETLTDLRDQRRALDKQFDGAMRAMAVVMIFFAAIIFFGAILNATLISISERRREMATFRTMGYYNYEVGRLFLRENMLTNILGTLVGIPLGSWMLSASMKGFDSDAYSFPAVLYTSSCVYTVLLAISFVLVSQLIVIRSLKKQNWVEALSLKE